MILDRFQLTDRVAIVTAAGRGIGAAIARAFAEVGADVVIGSRTESQLGEVAAGVRALGRRAAVVPGDLGSRSGMEALVDRAMQEFGRIDVVVNNAGGSMPGPFLSTTEEAFNEALRWNVTTAFNLTQLAVPHMLEGGGIHLTKNLATDLAPKVRVNVIAPGAIATSALDIVLQNEALERQMVERTPLKRIGDVEDIAAGAVYLASPASSYVTGRVLDIDGGVRRSNLDMNIPDLE